LWKSFVKFFVLLISGIILLLPKLAYSDPIITTIEAGECIEVPFNGTLLNNEAVAKVLGDKKFDEKELKLDYEFQLEKQKLTFQLEVDNWVIKYNSLQFQHTQILELKNNEIDRLMQELMEDEDYTIWIFMGGVVVGSLLAIGITYAVAGAF